MITINQQKKIKILYITGEGRSGSTLLNRLLDLHPRTFGVGEIFHLEAYYEHNDPCSCGQLVRECPIWSRVAERGVNLKRITHPYKGKHAKLKRFANLIGFISNQPLKKSYQENSAENKALFDALLAEVPENSIIVDSSKNFSRMLMLERSGLFDIMMMHLVRDGRAVLFSHKRPIRAKVERTKKTIMARRRKLTIEHVFRWMWVNLLLSGLIRHFFSKRYKLVRYEDLCVKPEETLNHIFSFAGLEPIIDIKRLLPGPISHLIGGNQMRFAKMTTIRLDSEYKSKLIIQDKLCFAIIAGWLNRIYGYR